MAARRDFCYGSLQEVSMPAQALTDEKLRPSKRFVKTSSGRESLETYEMANLYPRETGLPLTVWVSPRGRARHDARVKVCMTPGDRMDTTNCAVVAIRPEPRLVAGTLSSPVFETIARWIALNHDALIEYWDGELGTLEFATKMRRVTPSG
jgi:hypothetical protein